MITVPHSLLQKSHFCFYYYVQDYAMVLVNVTLLKIVLLSNFWAIVRVLWHAPIILSPSPILSVRGAYIYHLQKQNSSSHLPVYL